MHLRALLNWLCRAQDVRNGHFDDGSVSACWSFEHGWLRGYPETSGYIIETFIAAAACLRQPELRTRASRIVDWELSIQNADGSFPGHYGESGSRPVIFNTGQIMHGMVAGYLELGRNECLVAAVNAADWMVASQDDDGCWRRNELNGVPHTYNTRAAWALLRTGLLANDARIVAAARRNIDWALTQQSECGWFRANGFTADQTPFTHTIAYAIRGILECGVLLDDARYVDLALRGARGLAARQRADGFLAGTYGDGWVPQATYCCLTGVAQSALNWLRLDQHTGREEFDAPVERALEYLKRNHRVSGTCAPDDGGVAGSAPIWGGYAVFKYPNWAAKFFADALMTRILGRAIPSIDRGRTV